MMLYLFLLLKSFKLEIRLTNIQPDTLTFTDLRPVEQILKKIRSGLKVLEYGFITEQHHIFKRVIKPFKRVIFNLFIIFFISLVIYSVWQTNKIK